MDTKWVARGSGLALAGLIMATAATATEPQAAAQEASVTVQGVQVAISPTTGQLVAPTAEQRAALSRAMLQQSAGTSRKVGTLGQSAADRKSTRLNSSH